MQEDDQDQKSLRFFQMPKELFQDDTYTNLTNTAKLVYMLLRDRVQLSVKNRWLEDDGTPFIFFNQADIRDVLHIAKATCTKAMQELASYGLIEMVRQGAGRPNKVHLLKFNKCTSDYRILENRNHEVQILGIMNPKKQDSRSSNFRNHESYFLGSNDTDINETEFNETDGERADKSANAPQRKSQRFQPPTVEEVRAYCDSRYNQVDAEQFVDFYTAKGWLVGKNKMKDWKAAVRTWEKRDKQQHGKCWHQHGNKQAAIDTVNNLMRRYEAEERGVGNDKEDSDIESDWSFTTSV